MPLNTIFAPTRTLVRKDGLVTLKLADWESLQKHLQELRHALKVIVSGEHELKNKKTIRAASIDEALKIYGRRTAH